MEVVGGLAAMQETTLAKEILVVVEEGEGLVVVVVVGHMSLEVLVRQVSLVQGVMEVPPALATNLMVVLVQRVLQEVWEQRRESPTYQLYFWVLAVVEEEGVPEVQLGLLIVVPLQAVPAGTVVPEALGELAVELSLSKLQPLQIAGRFARMEQMGLTAVVGV